MCIRNMHSYKPPKELSWHDLLEGWKAKENLESDLTTLRLQHREQSRELELGQQRVAMLRDRVAELEEKLLALEALMLERDALLSCPRSECRGGGVSGSEPEPESRAECAPSLCPPLRESIPPSEPADLIDLYAESSSVDVPTDEVPHWLDTDMDWPRPSSVGASEPAASLLDDCDVAAAGAGSACADPVEEFSLVDAAVAPSERRFETDASPSSSPECSRASGSPVFDHQDASEPSCRWWSCSSVPKSLGAISEEAGPSSPPECSPASAPPVFDHEDGSASRLESSSRELPSERPASAES